MCLPHLCAGPLGLRHAVWVVLLAQLHKRLPDLDKKPRSSSMHVAAVKDDGTVLPEKGMGPVRQSTMAGGQPAATPSHHTVEGVHRDNSADPAVAPPPCLR